MIENFKKNSSWVLSYFFHPLFIPLYFFIIYWTHFPNDFFPKISSEEFLYSRFISLLFNTILYPLFSMFLLKKLGFIQSFQLDKTKDRIIPLILLMFFYWWMFKLYRDFSVKNIILKGFFLGCMLQTSWALVSNSFIKISLHGLGMGGFVFAFFYLFVIHNVFLWPTIPIMILIVFLVLASRYYLKKHTFTELFIGFISGLIIQAITMVFL